MNLETQESLTTILKNNPSIINILNELYGEELLVSTMYKIANNYELFKKFQHIKSKCTIDIIYSNHDNRVLLYVEQLGLYFLATHDEYTELANVLTVTCDPETNLNEIKFRFQNDFYNKYYKKHNSYPTEEQMSNYVKQKMENYKLPVPESIDIYQIVLTTERQKIVLVCQDNEAMIYELVKEIRKAFDTEVFIQRDKNTIEVTLANIVKDNINEASNFIKEMHKSISNRGEKLLNMVKTVEIYKTASGLEYAKFNISNSITRSHSKDVSKILKTMNIKINIKNLVVGNNNTLNYYKPSGMSELRPIVESWVLKNKIDGEITKEIYRNKFIEDTKLDINPNTFGKLISKYIKGTNVNGRNMYCMKNIE